MSSASGDRTFAGAILSIFLMLNVLLCAFNLIPLPPLDGASVIGIFLPTDAEVKLRELTRNPMFQIVGLFVAWQRLPRDRPSAVQAGPGRRAPGHV